MELARNLRFCEILVSTWKCENSETFGTKFEKQWVVAREYWMMVQLSPVDLKKMLSEVNLRFSSDSTGSYIAELEQKTGTWRIDKWNEKFRSQYRNSCEIENSSDRKIETSRLETQTGPCKTAQDWLSNRYIFSLCSRRRPWASRAAHHRLLCVLWGYINCMVQGDNTERFQGPTTGK